MANYKKSEKQRIMFLHDSDTNEDVCVFVDVKTAHNKYFTMSSLYGLGSHSKIELNTMTVLSNGTDKELLEMRVNEVFPYTRELEFSKHLLMSN